MRDSLWACDEMGVRITSSFSEQTLLQVIAHSSAAACEVSLIWWSVIRWRVITVSRELWALSRFLGSVKYWVLPV